MHAESACAEHAVKVVPAAHTLAVHAEHVPLELPAHPLAYWPAVQLHEVQVPAELPLHPLLYSPVVHAEQVMQEPPAVVEYLPAGHNSQAVLPEFFV